MSLLRVVRPAPRAEGRKGVAPWTIYCLLPARMTPAVRGRGSPPGYCRVITISRYSLGTTIPASPERLNRSICAIRSLSKAACAAGSNAANALRSGP
ncbi:hypothetical protein G6F22_021676 [Rhizopus arrhizus]|nr:hypothetical protein G6F22_021676 [Rhizopus arrhizus]